MSQTKPEPPNSDNSLPQQLAPRKEGWATRIGVILAVTGSAVGLGNFLRFPGEVANNGGGVFMIPYVIAFLLVGLPIAWVEWSLGRYGGSRGYHSAPGILRSVWKNPAAPYVGVLGLLIPVTIYMYYVFIEAWCLAYAWKYLTGGFDLQEGESYGDYFGRYVGAGGDGQVITSPLMVFLLICFVLNFVLIYRGLSKGIEWFCRIAMPALILLAVIIVIRVLTLGAPNPENPQQNITNGLGYMWNPVHQAHQLAPADSDLNAVIDGTPDTVEIVPRQEGEGFDELLIHRPQMFIASLVDSGWRSSAFAEQIPQKARDRLSQAQKALSEAQDQVDDLTVQHEAAEEQLRENHQSGDLAKKAGSLDAKLEQAQAKLEQAGDDYEQALESIVDQAQLAGVWSHPNSQLRIVLPEASEASEASEPPEASQPMRASIVAPGFWERLSQPKIWLAAVGQIFFSLSVGFGVVITYSSYLKERDDIALSSMTACAGNGFCEVSLAGMMIIPAAFIFLGPSFFAQANTFGLGFSALPEVFSQMPGGTGWIFGFLFFFLLFLAAVTSSLSMLQPAIAFLEEALGLNRRSSVAILGFITLVGASFVVYFSGGFKALGTLDFWAGTFFISLLATIQVIVFGWVLGMDKGFAELKRGAEIKIPWIVKPMIKYIAPLFLLTIFAMFFIRGDFAGQVAAIGQDRTVMLSVGLLLALAVTFLLLIGQAVKRWQSLEAQAGTVAAGKQAEASIEGSDTEKSGTEDSDTREASS